MNMKIISIATSKKKGTQKVTIDEAFLKKEPGLEGDAHSGPWHRQVSLLASESIETMRAQGLELAPGAFGENLVVVGLDLHAFGIRSRFPIGDVDLETPKAGNVCRSC